MLEDRKRKREDINTDLIGYKSESHILIIGFYLCIHTDCIRVPDKSEDTALNWVHSRSLSDKNCRQC